MLTLVTLTGAKCQRHDFINIFIFFRLVRSSSHTVLAGDKLVPAGSPGDPLHPGGVGAVHSGPGVHA